ncbi:uncharacterized protein PGTG_20361 [Puccinia graminis f. sp. tritici CRL 75-36-700-3]|uniref:Uncharacterized protein n=1 Tax=Puccinia graminis f. sp. tritici (strain CRL 75-36-700-3 / race SCCL) TaxID=418459 RepID=E3NXV6_PUCGT|nr:uncharacterized protein PGTG_20361 [Puccinia graminis f. sp. tritici CRL 75-36-700-3]EFP94405.1 hypothetical protein PGTG_20361 [Puccinia graminis f. sp. tritici CRL 75-36-700-3]
MWQESYTPSPPIQTANGYEFRIRYLEEVVHHLLAGTNPPQPPSISLAPLTSSFRYSAERGLVPLLSDSAAKSLANARSGNHLTYLSQAPSNEIHKTPPTQNLISRRSSSLPTPKSFQSTAKAPLRTSLQSYTDCHPRRPSASLDRLLNSKSQSNSFFLRATNAQSPLSGICSSPPDTKMSALETHNHTVTSSPSPHSISIATPNPSQLGFLDVDRYTNHLEIVCGQPSTDFVLCPEAHASSTMILDGPSTDAVSVREIPLTTQDPTLTQPLLNPPALDAILDTLASENIASENSITKASAQEVTHSDHPIGITTATVPYILPIPNQKTFAPDSEDTSNSLTPSESSPLTKQKNIQDSKLPTSTNSPLDPSLPDCSSSSCSLTHPVTPIAQPDNLEVAMVGGIKILDDDDSSLELRLAPEFSRETLEYYDDIDSYLKLANTVETEMKTKKKKKKKKKADPPSTSDNPVLFYV